MIINLFDLEKEFPNKLPDAIEGYYSSGARDEVTLKRNRSIFDEYELLPKFLKDVSFLLEKNKGIFYLEFQDLLSIIKNNLFDTIFLDSIRFIFSQN